MKKRLLRSLLVVLVFTSVVALAACSSGKEKDDGKKEKSEEKVTEAVTEAAPEPAEEGDKLTIATTETWGDYTVGIPKDWEFTKGDYFDENDTRYCSVKKSMFCYFDFKMETEEVMNNQYNYNKNTYTNEQKDVSGTYGSIDWTGFQYSDGFGGYGFELYSTVNGKPIRVSSAGYKFDSEEAKTVLESLVIK